MCLRLPLHAFPGYPASAAAHALYVLPSLNPVARAALTRRMRWPMCAQTCIGERLPPRSSKCHLVRGEDGPPARRAGGHLLHEVRHQPVLDDHFPVGPGIRGVPSGARPEDESDARRRNASYERSTTVISIHRHRRAMVSMMRPNAVSGTGPPSAGLSSLCHATRAREDLGNLSFSSGARCMRPEKVFKAFWKPAPRT